MDKIIRAKWQFLQGVGFDCQVPLGLLVDTRGDGIHIYGFKSDMRGNEWVSFNETCDRSELTDVMDRVIETIS